MDIDTRIVCFCELIWSDARSVRISNWGRCDFLRRRRICGQGWAETSDVIGLACVDGVNSVFLSPCIQSG
jgi:glutamine cyclotransferase